MSRLFRDIDNGRPSGSFGEVQLASPTSHLFWTAVASICLASFIALLFLGHYTRRVRVNGIIIPRQGLITINSRINGQVDELFVHEGDFVEGGSKLLRSSSDKESAGGDLASKEMRRSLNTQINDINRDIDNEKRNYASQYNDLVSQTRSLGMQISAFNSQRDTALKQLNLYKTLLNKLRPLGAQNYISAYEIEQQQAQVLQAESQVKSLDRQLIELKQQLHTMRERLYELPSDSQKHLDEFDRLKLQTKQTALQADLEASTVLRTPIPGVVSSILVYPGQSIGTGQALLSVMPSNSALVVQLLVPSRAIGFVHIGTPVAGKIQAFPFQKYGIAKGTVIQVSQNALTPLEVSQLMGGKAAEEPQYRVLVQLTSRPTSPLGKLQPGMLVEANLLLERRRLGAWIFEPILGLKQDLQASH